MISVVMGGLILLCDQLDCLILLTHPARTIDAPHGDAPPLPFRSPGMYPSAIVTSVFESRVTPLRLFKKSDSVPVGLESGDTVLEGDEVQIQYHTSQLYGVILSVDGRGVVSQHYPDEGDVSTRIAVGIHLLPFAFMLDDAPGYEVFFFITSDSPLDLQRIHEKTQQLKSADELPQLADDNIQIRKVVLHKAVRE